MVGFCGGCEFSLVVQSTNNQAPNTVGARSRFAVWSLKFLWSLDVGAWSFS
jgi:hypothetical protein